MRRIYLGDNEVPASDDQSQLHSYLTELPDHRPQVIAVDMVHSKLYTEVCWVQGCYFLGLRSAKGMWFIGRGITKDRAAVVLSNPESVREEVDVLEREAVRDFEESLAPRKALFETEHDPMLDRINRWFLRRAWADHISDEAAKARAIQHLEFAPFEKYYLSLAAFSFLGDWS